MKKRLESRFTDLKTQIENERFGSMYQNVRRLPIKDHNPQAYVSGVRRMHRAKQPRQSRQYKQS